MIRRKGKKKNKSSASENKRLSIIGGIICIAFGGVICRMAYVSLITGNKDKAEANAEWRSE